MLSAHDDLVSLLFAPFVWAASFYDYLEPIYHFACARSAVALSSIFRSGARKKADSKWFVAKRDHDRAKKWSHIFCKYYVTFWPSKSGNYRDECVLLSIINAQTRTKAPS